MQFEGPSAQPGTRPWQQNLFGPLLDRALCATAAMGSLSKGAYLTHAYLTVTHAPQQPAHIIHMMVSHPPPSHHLTISPSHTLIHHYHTPHTSQLPCRHHSIACTNTYPRRRRPRWGLGPW